MMRIILGLIIVMGAVGGIEQSQTDWDLGLACFIAAFGLMLMRSGTTAVKE